MKALYIKAAAPAIDISRNDMLYCLAFNINSILAGMAELADALDLGSSEGNFVQVQILLPAPRQGKVRSA